jgi:uncharacterized peroxidase-related enzyme
MAAAFKMADPAENPFLANLEDRTRKANQFYRMMGLRPAVLESFVPLYKAVMGPGAVDRRLKELVYLACACANRCAYCTATHVAAGKKAGISEQETAAVREERDEGLAAAEQAAVHYARELTRTADAAQTRAALRELFNDEQVVEITLVAAMANFTNRFNNGLLVMPEE